MQKKYPTRIILIILLLSISIYFIFLSGRTKKNILNNDLQYSKELGWINWRHAKPDRTIEALKRFQYQNRQSDTTFSFDYSQKMKFKLFGSYLVAEHIEYRKVVPHLSVEQERAAFLDIFKSVSISFEKMQSDYPYILIPDAEASSFRGGDLMGNLLSFYLATSEAELNEVKTSLTLLNANEALKKYNKEGLGKVKDWSAIEFPNDSSNEVIRVLKKICIVPRNQKPLSIKISEKNKFYIEN